MQHEGISFAAELGDEKRHALGHQARHKGIVARELVEFRDQDAASSRL
jgi:hypothetical protein